MDLAGPFPSNGHILESRQQHHPLAHQLTLLPSHCSDCLCLEHVNNAIVTVFGYCLEVYTITQLLPVKQELDAQAPTWDNIRQATKQPPDGSINTHTYKPSNASRHGSGLHIMLRRYISSCSHIYPRQKLTRAQGKLEMACMSPS